MRTRSHPGFHSKTASLAAEEGLVRGGPRFRPTAILRVLVAISVGLQSIGSRAIALLSPLALVTFTARALHAKLFLTQEQALARAFPTGSRIDRRTAYLTPEQIKTVEQKSRVKINSGVITYYAGYRENILEGMAFFDTRVVRTMPMTLMIFIKPNGTIASVDVLSFSEPEDYLPRPRWFSLFQNRTASDNVRLRKDIPNVTGSTLTCHAVTDGIRQTAAIFDLLREHR